MIHKQIKAYIETETARGASKEAIVGALTTAGWLPADIEEAYQSPARGASSSPAQRITEKDYPITLLWVFKGPLIIILISVIALFFGIWFPYFVIALPILLIANPLTRHYFHYSLEDKLFIVDQGVISKKHRSLPYGVIQNVFVKQDLFDRIFGLATLRVENATNNEKVSRRSFRLTGVASQQEGLGSTGNKINIPGLRKKAAEELKNIILQRMKANPIEDSQSGL